MIILPIFKGNLHLTLANKTNKQTSKNPNFSNEIEYIRAAIFDFSNTSQKMHLLCKLFNVLRIRI